MGESATSGVFELSFASDGPAVTVVSFTGREQISRPYRFDVTVEVASRDASRFANEVLGAAASFALSTRAGPREIGGVVSRVTALAVDPEKDCSRFVVRLVPRLWTLGARKTNRIFQDETVPEIVTEVLRGAGVAHTWRLAGQHGTRAYSVQYQETDLEYVSRLLAEEGIFYFFEEPGEAGRSEVVVLADVATHYPVVAGDAVFPFAPPSGLVRPPGDLIESFALRQQIRSGASRVKNFDFRRPDTDLSSSAAVEPRPRVDEATLEVYEYDFAPEDDEAVAGAAVRRLEQLRTRGQVSSGRSRSARLAVGRRFVLDGHPGEGHNGEYAVVKLTHQGRVPEAAFGHTASGETVEVYSNAFECLPAAVAARPPKRERRIQQVLETATVVGPAGEEIHTDEHGRIKVAFHWDRRGRRGDQSSCWIRCMQTWAGASWGTQKLTMTPAGIEIDAPFISLKSGGEIHIDAVGNVVVTGALITLN